VVRGTTIFNGPHSAIIYSGNDHVFEDNVIAQLVTEAGDSGFFYTGRDFTAQGNVIRRNVLLGTGNKSFQDVAMNNARGIYLDEFSSGNTVAENVIIGLPYSILLNGGKDNKILSNLIVFGTPPIWISALGYAPWWQRWRNDHMAVPNGISVKNLYRLPIRDPVWSARYPQLQNYPDSDLLLPERNLIEGNRIVGRNQTVVVDGKFEVATQKDNRLIRYRHFSDIRKVLREPIKFESIDQTLALVSQALDSYQINHRPLRLPASAGSVLAPSFSEASGR
jgi:hypothetical protein